MYEVPFEVEDAGYAEALGVLRSALRFGICPMLESVEDMLAELGNPDACFRSVQVAGTNGKTSTARFTAAILSGEGLRVALYTSPELVSYTERMEVGGAPVSEGAFAHGIMAARAAGERVNGRRVAAHERPYDITEFDLITVAAAVVFAEAGVDVAVMECGMGGRWDATSAVGSIEAVCVTGIGLDHMHVLGDTLEAIAGEKAAIIKPGRACVLGAGTATPDSVEDVLLGQCEASGVTPVLLRPEVLSDAEGEMHPGTPRAHEGLPHASFRVVRRPSALGGELALDVGTPYGTYQGISTRKPGYQAANIACAVALAEAFLARALPPAHVCESVSSCPTPGRFDVVRADPLALIDACHNPQSVETFLTAVRAVEPEVARRPQLLCAVLADKDVEGIVRLLAPEFPRVSVTRTSSARALPAERLGELFAQAGRTPEHVWPDVATALGALAGEPFVACGSITLAGEVAGILR
jgi:dihydrofolate synthase/folylpolyglutamate synthase